MAHHLSRSPLNLSAGSRRCFPDENLSPNFSPSLAPNNNQWDKPGLKQQHRPPIADDHDSSTLSFDSEIESIHNDIALLSQRLHALRLAHPNHYPADPLLKQSTTITMTTPKVVRICDPPAVSTAKSRPRGVSMCPADIARPMKLPDHSLNRRKSCFWKIPPLLEEEENTAAHLDKARARRRLSLAPGTNVLRSRTLSPKSRQSKLADLRKGIATVGSKSNNNLVGRKDQEVAASSRLQPKILFGDAKPAPAAKPALKNARVVPSRYSQIPTTTFSSRAAAARPSPAKEMKKKKQPRPLVDGYGTRKRCGASEDERSSVSSCTTESWPLEEVAVALPRIKEMRYLGDSPRDSGRAKRVAELVGKTTYFTRDAPVEKDDDLPIFKVVDYDDDDEDDDYMSL